VDVARRDRNLISAVASHRCGSGLLRRFAPRNYALRQRLPRLVNIRRSHLRHTVAEEAVDEIRHRSEFVVAVAAGERRHESMLDRQRGVGAGEQDRLQIGGVGVVDGAAGTQVGVGRLHALAVPIVAIGAVAAALRRTK
jgi:hypothetical protein